MKVVVCGGRGERDRERIFNMLDALNRQLKITELMQGGAQGVDAFAREWAEARGIKCHTVAADWRGEGLAAGPIRNARMVSWGPDLVIAFPGGRGTANMV